MLEWIKVFDPSSVGIAKTAEKTLDHTAYNICRYMKLFTASSTLDKKFDRVEQQTAKGLKGITANTIRIARLKLLFIAAKVVQDQNQDKVKYSIHDARAATMAGFLRRGRSPAPELK